MDEKLLLNLILSNLEEGIIVTDANANILFYKESSTNIGGIDAQTALGKNILEVFSKLTEETSSFYQVIKTRRPLIEQIQHYTNYQGRNVSTVTSTIPIIENDELKGCLEIFKDLTHVVDLSEKVISLQKQLYHKSDRAKTPNHNGTMYTFDNIIGNSPIITELKEKAKKIADSDSPIFVYGETGTGKELLVHAIHNQSRKRRNKLFIAQNCAALPYNLIESILFGTSSGSFTGAKDNPGLFELADGGTLFLDEINSLDIALQAKLLRVLQDGIVRRIGDSKTRVIDVRIVAATNVEPLELLEKKLLREDLFYRLNAVYLAVPPLRERNGDIRYLVDYFINKNNEKVKSHVAGITPDLLEMFKSYSWPGNIRELEHLIESIMNLSENPLLDINDLNYYFDKGFLQKAGLQENIENESIRVYHSESLQKNASGMAPSFPDQFSGGLNFNQAVENFEKSLIVQAINESNGNYSKAARMLNIPKQTLHNKIKKYNIRLKADTFYN